MTRLWAGMVGALIVGSTATTAVAQDVRVEKTLPATSGGTLTVEADLGTVEVSTGTASQVVARVSMKPGSDPAAAESFFSRFRFSFDAAPGGGVRVRVENTQKGVRVASTGAELFVRVTVPKQYNLSLNTAAGALLVSGVTGSVRGSTAGGRVEVRDVTGEVQLNTSGGNILARNLTGRTRLTTSGGDLDVASVSGSVDLTSAGGSITVAGVSGKLGANTSGGNITATLVAAPEDVRLNTSGGTITLSLSRQTAALIDLETFAGNVQGDLPGFDGTRKPDRVQGKLNAGGRATIRAATSGGGIVLKTL